MRFVVDACNLLGAMGLPRESDSAKRELVQRLASFARAVRCKTECVFDGARPHGFPSHLGELSVRFAHPRSADDQIAAMLEAPLGPTTLVTNDRALAGRLKSRRVTIESCSEFRSRLERSTREAEVEHRTDDDWEGYFSDPKNRNV